jgi:TIR domain-containing protein
MPASSFWHGTGVPVGHIKFKITIIGDLARGESRPVGDMAHIYNNIFVSYATKDRTEVLKRLQMLSSMRIPFFQDLLNLKPGDRWRRELFRHIDESDLFLLFWSRAAKRSSWVRKEVRYALDRKVANDDGPPEIMPVIIEGPPVPRPYPELRHLHFNDQVLYVINGKS